MARIEGVDIPNKHISIALTYIYGIGRPAARDICEKAKVDPQKLANDLTEEEKKSFDYDMLVFFSPTGVRALKKNLPDFEQGDIKIAAFGPATAKEVKDQGLRLDLEAPSAKYPSMTGALRAFLEEQKK